MRIAAVIISLLLAACSTTKVQFGRLPDTEVEEGKVSIAYLKTLCGDRSTIIDKDVSVAGRVVANDLFGEFYRTIVIADDSGGIEIAVDGSRLYTHFPIFSEVAVICNGLALGRTGGKIALGAPPEGEYATDRIAYEDIPRYFSVAEGYPDTFPPQTLTIGELSVEHVSAFVMFEDVIFAEEERGMPWCDTADGDFVESVRHFSDRDGNTLAVKIRGTAEYASEKIPSGRMTLAGIIDYSYGEFFLRISNRYYIERY